MLIQIADRNTSIPNKKASHILLREPGITDQAYLNLCSELKISSKQLIVHTKVDIAHKLGAYALHMRYLDYLLRGKVYPTIGVSVHSLEELKVIEMNNDVDYVLLSPIFKTKSKPGVTPKGLSFLKKGKEIYSGKVIALGGINKNNIHTALSIGDGIAAIGYFKK